MPHREPLFRYWVGGVVTAMWTVSLVIDMFNPLYDPPTGLGGVMLAVATGIFGAPVVSEIRRRSNER